MFNVLQREGIAFLIIKNVNKIFDIYNNLSIFTGFDIKTNLAIPSSPRSTTKWSKYINWINRSIQTLQL